MMEGVVSREAWRYLWNLEDLSHGVPRLFAACSTEWESSKHADYYIAETM